MLTFHPKPPSHLSPPSSMQQQVSATSVCHSEKESCSNNAEERFTFTTLSKPELLFQDCHKRYGTSFPSGILEVRHWERTVNAFECSIVTLFFVVWSHTFEASFRRGGNICILSLKRIQQCNQVFSCQQFQRYQNAHTHRHRHTLTANKHLDVVYHWECVCTGFSWGC